MDTRAAIAASRAYLESLGRPAAVELLRAFGSEELPAPAGSLSRYVKALAFEPLARAIIATLNQEVDGGQAELFSRRFRSVSQLLAGMKEPEAPAYRVALHARVSEILAAPGPRALRVRAAVDFWYSHGAVLHHHSQRTAAGFQSTRTLTQIGAHTLWNRIGPGVEWAQINEFGPWGPLHVNALRLGDVRLVARDIRDRGGALRTEARRRGAIAALSGGFFLYSEPDITSPSVRTDPVGLLVESGQLTSPPVFRRSALLWRSGRGAAIKNIGLEHGYFEIPGAAPFRARYATVERPVPEGAEDVVAYTRAQGRSTPRAAVAVAIVGSRVVSAGPGPLRVPLAGFVLTANSGGPLDSIGVDTSVEFRLDEPADAAVAGGPRLVSPNVPVRDLVAEDFAGDAPPITFSADETFDQNLLPRMAVGIDSEGRLIFVAVDGRNFHRAPGLTLGQTAELIESLGAVEAMNLDGGASKRMIVQGETVDLPSTEVVAGGSANSNVRPVHIGLFVHSKGQSEA